MSNVIKKVSGKKLRAVKEKVDSTKFYEMADAIEFLQTNKVAKFDESLDVAIKLGVDPTHSDQNVRGVSVMPSGLGKSVRIAAIVKDANIERAKNAGADIVGLENIIDDIKAGKVDFDVCIATPDVMPALSAVAKVLGPKGLMPNPKLGTVTNDIENAIKLAKAGQVEYRSEKGGIVHAGVGKLSFTKDALIANIKALVDSVIKAKPATSKGVYLKAIFVSSTMGPALKINMTEFGKI